MIKSKRNNFGVKGFSIPHKSFFNKLLQPVNRKLVKNSKNIFPDVDKIKKLTMTREELVKELKKIKGVEVVQSITSDPIIEGDIVIFHKDSNNKDVSFIYTYSNDLIMGKVLPVSYKNRTPEQVLSVVKALVE